MGIFGDAFIEGTILEGSSWLAWSYKVLNFALQRTITRQRRILTGFTPTDFGIVSDVLHTLSKSTIVFEEMARLLKNPSTQQLMKFLRKIYIRIT